MDIVRTSAAVAAALVAAQAAAQNIFDEAVLGEFSDDAAAPTALAFGLGSNIVSGSVTQSNDLANGNRDFFTFTIGAGQELAAVNVLAWADVATGDPNQGFIAATLGATGVAPSGPGAGDADLFVLGALIGGDDVGQLDFLDELAANAAGDAFVGPVGPGTYTFVVQQTGPQNSGYSIEFEVVPAPGAAAGIGLAGLLAARRRR